MRIPRSVAVVGASHGEGGSYYGSRMMSNLVTAGPKATLYPVNPRLAGTEIFGHLAYASLTDLPEVPDLVIVTTPIKTVVPILREAGGLGVPISVVISNHQGEESARRAFDAAIAEVAAATGMRIIGPNSMGVLHGHASLSATFSSGAHGGGIRPGNVAALGQSGAVIAYLLAEFQHRTLGYSWLISTGNEVAASTEELLDELIEDDDTQVVLLFVEGVSDGARFRQAALRARRAGKAIVMLKVGLSESGMRAVQSHTGRIAGTKAVYDAVAAESGIIDVSTYQEFFDATVALSQQAIERSALPHNRRAVVLTTSGGAGTYTADRLSELGWTLPELRPEIASAVEAICGQEGVHNPVDITGAFGDPSRLGRILTELAADETVDAFFIATGAGGQLGEAVAQSLVDARPKVPQEVYVGWVGMSDGVRAKLDAAGLPPFGDPARAAFAADVSARFRSFPQAAADELLAKLTAGVPPQTATTEPQWQTAADAMAELQRNGIGGGSGVTDTLDPEEAVGLAEQIGYPAVVKIDSPSLNHKSDAGGVILDLRDEAAVRAAVKGFAELAATHGFERPRAVVQRMVRGVEVLVGLKRDPAFGLLLVAGLGGTAAELYADAIGTVSTVLPTTRTQLDAMLSRHQTLDTLLAGYRGAPPADREALLDLLESLSTWAVTREGAVHEADLNPVVVNEHGAFVVDARILAS
ncbi:acetate--CoA ligase family protein [Kribbella sp. NPDC049227]|uniref:acetate--CoA ligase family protein n=1 Tax=Kribbella sp. NPDC049227 TaxID=3364113 RepID=UPI003722A515